MLNVADSFARGETFSPMGFGMTVIFLLILLFLFFSALLTGAGVDYFGSESEERQRLSKSKRDAKLLQNLDNLDNIMATVLILNILANVSVVILSFYFVSHVSQSNRLTLLEFVIFVLAVSGIILLFGEILPRIYAVRHPWKCARILACPLSFMERVFRPLNYIFLHSLSKVRSGLKRQMQKNLSVSEISHALELTSEDEIPADKEILEGIVNFGSKSVAEIMCPRVDVVTLDIKSSFRKVLDVINESGYSRIPVCDESFDQVKGILYIKDLLPHTEKGDGFRWQEFLRPPFFIPETKRVKDLLEDFQKNKIHMAVVVDEYGGSSGIVTLEDVLEEIVGDIADEFDEDESYFTRLAEKKFLFDGKTPLDKFYEVVGYDEAYFAEAKGDADTLAGLILEVNGDIPKYHDSITFRDFHFTIELVTNRRIQKVKVDL